MDEFINRLDDKWLNDNTIVKLYSNQNNKKFAVEVVYTDIDDNDWEEFDNLTDAVFSWFDKFYTEHLRKNF
tara:strand:- start:290 stop:502 length:213 start_codon:yes stop_codon:yes gene_type:complete